MYRVLVSALTKPLCALTKPLNPTKPLYTGNMLRFFYKSLLYRGLVSALTKPLCALTKPLNTTKPLYTAVGSRRKEVV